MTDDYTPLTDEQVEAMLRRGIRSMLGDLGDDIRLILRDRAYWKRRAEAAEEHIPKPGVPYCASCGKYKAACDGC